MVNLSLLVMIPVPAGQNLPVDPSVIVCQPADVRQEAVPTNESAEPDNGAQASSLCVVCMINVQMQ